MGRLVAGDIPSEPGRAYDVGVDEVLEDILLVGPSSVIDFVGCNCDEGVRS